MAFQSVAVLAKRAQYKVTQRPIAYSVNGGMHNASGKTICIRWRLEIAEEMGWRLGDCVDIRTDTDQPNVIMVVKCDERGYKLFAASKRNGIACLYNRVRWQDSLGFPNVFIQVGCDVVEMIDGGVIFRIRVEDDEKPLGDMSYKEPTKIEGDAFGFTPRTLTHGFNDQKSIKEIRREMEAEEKIKKGERAEARLARIRDIALRPRRPTQ